MRLVVCIVLLLGVLPAVLSMPALHKRKELSSLFRKMRQVNGNCQELADSAGAVERNIRDLVSLVAADTLPNLDDDFFEAVSQKVFGFDMADDDEERTVYTCDITDVTAVSELKGVLDAKQFNLNFLSLLYDYGTAFLPFRGVGMNTGPELALLHALESVGLTTLDPEGTVWIGEAMFGEMYTFLVSMYQPAPLFPGSNQAKCSHVTNALRAVIRDDQGLAEFEQQWVGLSPQDLRAMICDVVDAVDGGLSAIYDVIDDYGIMNSIYRLAYPYLKTYLTTAISELEQYEAMITMTQQLLDQQEANPHPSRHVRTPPGQHNVGQIPHYGNPYYYGHLYASGTFTYDPDPYSSYGDYGPNEGGSGPDIPPNLPQLIPIILRFLHALQDSGLLDLPNDL